MAKSHYRAICSLLILCLLITCKVRCSQALSSAINPSYNRWRASPGSTAKFNPTPLRALIVGLSTSFFAVSAPSSSTIMLETFARSISTAYEVLIARLVDTVPACDVRVCNSCRLEWMANNSSFYCCSNYCSASAVTSHTVSLMSCKSPSVRVIGSNDVLVALDFFLDPPFSCSLGRLIRENVSYGFVPCFFVCSSISSSVLGECNLVPLLEPCSVPPVYFSVYWVASCSA